jgi:spermidine/putrescine transport system permease protein
LETPRRNPRLFSLVSIPPSAWLLAFFLVPLALVWAMSFGEKVGLIDIAYTWTLDNYARAVDPLYLGVFGKSLWFASLTTAICLAVGFVVAMGISFGPARWRVPLLILVMLPFWTNLLIRTYALIAVFRTRGVVNGGLEQLWEWANGLLALVGLGHLELLGPRFEPLELLYNNFAVVAGLVYVHLPFMVLPLYAALERMDHSYIEASLDLGAGHFRTIFAVMIPLAMPGIVTGVIITFVPALGSFLTPDLLGGTDSQMIANVIERQFKSANDWPFGAALSFLLMYVTFFAIALRAVWVSRQRHTRGVA